MAAPGKTEIDLEALKAVSMIEDNVTPLADWLVVTPVLIPFIAGALIVVFRNRSELHPPITLLAFFLLILSNLALVAKVSAEGLVTMTMGQWLPPFGIAFSVDLMSALFAMATSIAAFAVALYAIDDIPANERGFGFFGFLLLLVGGVSGAFLTGDLFNLYVWFEVLLISSFGLIVYGGDKVQLDGAVKYAVLNFLATTFFLIATGLIYGLTGTLNFADLARLIPELEATAPVAAVSALFILAFAMKAAAFPLNMWLPASYHTPRLVVSAIFAGLLTKVGVYALFRLMSLVFVEPPDVYRSVLIGVAIATMLVGVFGALAQNNIRRLLGFVVVSGIGMMLIGIALMTKDALAAAIFYAVHSMVVMTALYLAVGMIERNTRTSLLSEVGGIYRRDPLLSGTFLVLVFAVSGLPPFSGFWAKIALVKASMDVNETLLVAAILFSGFLTTIAMARVWALAFWRPAATNGYGAGIQSPQNNSTHTNGQMVALLTLTALVVGFGLYPEIIFSLVDVGARDLIDPSQYIRDTLEPYDQIFSGENGLVPNPGEGLVDGGDDSGQGVE